MTGFVHLHVHSSYSLLEGALTISRLADLAKADRQPALALTDTDNMFGALEFSEKMAAAGIQPIIGCALAVEFHDQESGPRPAGHTTAARPRIVLLAARESGYRSLMRLNSRAFLESPTNEQPRVELGWLEDETRRTDRPDRGTGRTARRGNPRRPGQSRDPPLRGAGTAVREPALRRAAATRYRGRAHHRTLAHRPRLCSRHPAGGNERAGVRPTGGLRGS